MLIAPKEKESLGIEMVSSMLHFVLVNVSSCIELWCVSTVVWYWAAHLFLKKRRKKEKVSKTLYRLALCRQMHYSLLLFPFSFLPCVCVCVLLKSNKYCKRFGQSEWLKKKKKKKKKCLLAALSFSLPPFSLSLPRGIIISFVASEKRRRRNVVS